MNVPQVTIPAPSQKKAPPRPPKDSTGPVVLDAIRKAFAARLSGSPKACAVVYKGLLLAITPRADHRMARYPIGTVVVRIADGVVLGTRERR